MKLSIHKRCSCFTPLFFLLESQVGYHTTERNRVSNWCQRKHGNAYFVDELNHLLVCSAGASPRDESSLHIIGLNQPLSMGAGVVKNKIWYWATRKRSSRNWRGCNRRIRCDEERRKHLRVKSNHEQNNFYFKTYSVCLHDSQSNKTSQHHHNNYCTLLKLTTHYIYFNVF